MRKSVKVTLIAVAALIALLISTLLVIPIVLQGRVAELLRSELNERLDATVDFEEVDLSLLSTFPTFTAEIVGLELVGKGPFEGKKLLSIESLQAGIDLLSLLRDEQIVVESITVERPELHVLVNEEGLANYDIVKSAPEEEVEAATAGDSAELELQVRSYRIIDALITYEAPGTQLSLEGLEHEGLATISGPTHLLASTTKVDRLSATLGPVTYLKEARLRLELASTVQTDRRRANFSKVKLTLNELAATGSGTVGWAGEGVELNLQLGTAERQSIRGLVSAIPNAYAADFAGLEASGVFSAGAKVKGTLGPGEDDIPSFSAHLDVRRGRFKYPDLPLPITDLVLSAKLTHPGGNLDAMRIDVSNYGMRAGKSHASGRANVSTPLSELGLRLLLDADLDLAELARAYPIPGAQELTGQVRANVDLVAHGERIERLEGDVRLAEFRYRVEDLPDVRIDEAHLRLSPKSTGLEVFTAKLGRSDVALTGTLSPLLAFLDEEQLISGNLALSSQALYVDDFLSDEADEQVAQETTPFLLPKNVDAKLAVEVKKLTYDELVLTDFVGSARVRDRKLTLSNVKADGLGGSMKLSGTVSTPVGQPARFELRYEVDEVSFAEAAKALPALRAYAPVTSFLQGRFSTDLEASGELGEDGAPTLSSIDAGGLLMAMQSKLGPDFKPLAALSKAVPAIPTPLNLSSFETRFDIRDGAVHVKPFTVKAKGLPMTVSGSHGLDQQMSYELSTPVPIEALTGDLAKRVAGLGLDASRVSSVDVRAKLTGSLQEPRVTVDVDTDSLRAAAADMVSAELRKQQDKALAALAIQNAKMVAEAEKRAAQVRKEAARAAKKVRNEANKRAEQLVTEAGSNPIKQRIAKEGAKQIRKEGDKRAAQLEREADERAEQIVAEAEKRAAQLSAEASKQSQRASAATQNSIAK